MTRIVYQTTGSMLVGIALVGAFLPLLPSTPFLLLASVCFMRSNPAWNEKLLRSPVFGRMLSDWQTYRCVRPRAKALAIGSMVVVGGASLLLVAIPLFAKAAMIAAMSAAAVLIVRLPSHAATRRVVPCLE
jgi:uncharacterized membrane protein YbaN (DUF454 family)